jgi:hypothetical protein
MTADIGIEDAEESGDWAVLEKTGFDDDDELGYGSKDGFVRISGTGAADRGEV